MVKHNNIIPNIHLHKKWATSSRGPLKVVTWFDQAAQKKVRRLRRQLKAARIAPRPAAGPLRPSVHCQTIKYNSKLRLGRGFSLEELKAAGISKRLAPTIGIAVDYRRKNKSGESIERNVKRLKEYKRRLVLFPLDPANPKPEDSNPKSLTKARQFSSTLLPVKGTSTAVKFVTLTQEMKDFKAYRQLSKARKNQRRAGKRAKKGRKIAAYKSKKI